MKDDYEDMFEHSDSDSEDESRHQGSNHDEMETIARSRIGSKRTTKRDKFKVDDDDDDFASDDDQEKKMETNDIDDEDHIKSESESEKTEVKESKKTVKPLTEKKLKKLQSKIKKTGVIYLSSIPPYMKPFALEKILSKFGPTNRIFLKPEDSKTHTLRKHSGGNKKMKYTEGWVEFKRKKDAKKCVLALNGNPIGGKKSSYYHDDILNIRYLHKYKWHNLVEDIAVEKRKFQEQMMTEIEQAKKDNNTFIENVERSKAIAGMQEKRRQKSLKENKTTTTVPDKKKEPTIRRTFAQRKVVSNRASDPESQKKTIDSKLNGVLNKIF